MFYADDVQLARAKEFVAALERESPGGAPIVTTFEPLTAFYPAEDYHRDYYARNKDAGYCQAVINPKLRKVKEAFAALLDASASAE